MVSLCLIAIVAGGVLRVTNGALIENRKYHVTTVMHELALDRLEDVTAAFPVLEKLEGTEASLHPIELGSNIRFTRVTEIDYPNNLAIVTVSTRPNQGAGTSQSEQFFFAHSITLKRRMIQW